MLMPELLLALLLALFGVFCVCLLFLAVCALFVTKKEYIHNSRFYRALLCRSSAFALWFLRVHVHVSGIELLPLHVRYPQGAEKPAQHPNCTGFLEQVF